MATRGRAPGFTMSNEHRLKIQKSNVLNALISHVVDGREMTSSQVTAGIALLKKCLPDLSSVEVSGPEDENGKPTAIQINIVDPRS